MVGIDTFLAHYGLLAIFLLLLMKTAGVPLPIPADVILLATAARVAQGKFILWQAGVIVLIAMVLGGLIQFLLARGPARGLLFRFGRYLGLTPARLEAASARVKKGGLIGMSIAVLVPGVRGVAIPAAGLAGLSLRIFLPGLVLGSVLFLSIHFLLGYLGGSLLVGLGKTPLSSLILVLVVVLLLAIFGLWLFTLRRGRSDRGEIQAAALETWHEGICPVCLALSTINMHASPNARPDHRGVSSPQIEA